MQEAATKVSVNQLAESVDEQYLVKIKQECVGYKNQTPLTIINHLYNTWVKVTNADKVAALEAFHFNWNDTPNTHIRTFTRQLDKIQRRLRKMKVPCTDEAMVIQYVDQMNKSRIFK